MAQWNASISKLAGDCATALLLYYCTALLLYCYCFTSGTKVVAGGFTRVTQSENQSSRVWIVLVDVMVERCYGS
jgi:hypothetical protein